MEGTIIKYIDATFLWLKAIGSVTSAIIEISGGDFRGFQDMADRIDTTDRVTLVAFKGGAIRDQILTATVKFRIIGEGFKQNRDHLENKKKIINLQTEETNSDG